MKKLSLILLVALASCNARTSKTDLSKQTEAKKENINLKTAENTKSKEVFKIADSVKVSKKDTKLDSFEKSEDTKSSEMVQDSQKDTKFSLSLKNNGNALNSNLIGNLVLQNGPNSFTSIPISSNTELLVEDFESLKAKNNKIEQSYSSLTKSFSKLSVEYDSIKSLSANLEKSLNITKTNELKYKTAWEQSKKDKSKETAKKGPGFLAYFFGVILIALISILIWEYFKKQLWRTN